MSQPTIEQFEQMMSDKVDKTQMYVSMEQSQAYVENRPRYTKEMFQAIVDYCKETTSNLELAVDVGCGPGMSTMGFAKDFKKCIGIDVSETQIKCAVKGIPNCEFKVGYSHQLPFIKTGTVDLFCSGEAFNLMPKKETFAEADRVLKPGGTLAIFGYDFPTCENTEVNDVLSKLGMKIIPYYPKETAQLLGRLMTLELPYPGWIRNDELKMHEKTTAEKYAESVKSLWASRAYRDAHPEEDLIGDLARDINAALERTGSGKEFTVSWNLFVLMGHKPKK